MVLNFRVIMMCSFNVGVGIWLRIASPWLKECSSISLFLMKQISYQMLEGICETGSVSSESVVKGFLFANTRGGSFLVKVLLIVKEIQWIILADQV